MRQPRSKFPKVIQIGMILLSMMLLGLNAAGQMPMNRLRSGLFEIAYSKPDEAIAQETLRILEKAAAQYEVHLPLGNNPVQVLLCHSATQFNTLAGTYGFSRVGALAKPRESLILLKSPAILPPDNDYGGIVRHELIHVALARNVNEANTPRWFEEGIAMVVSEELRLESILHLGRMYVQRRIIPYNELDFAFASAGNEERFGDAYAEALSLTQYVQRQTGKASFWALVKALKTESFDAALLRYTKLTPGALFTGWNHSLWKVAVITSLVSGFSLFQFMAILVLIAYWRKHRRGKQILQEWADEEEQETEEEGETPEIWWEEEETVDGDDHDKP